MPEHFQRFLDNLSGELGSLAAFGKSLICPADRAQYASPFFVLGFTLAPFWPYETFLPVDVTLTLALPLLGFIIVLWQIKRGYCFAC